MYLLQKVTQRFHFQELLMRKIQKGLSFEIMTSRRVLDLKCLRDQSGLKWTVRPKFCISEIYTPIPVLQKWNFFNKEQKRNCILGIVPKAVSLIRFFNFL